MTSTLLHDVLRPHGIDSLNQRLTQVSLGKSTANADDSEDDIVGVQSLPGTPARSRPTSRPPSPTRGANKRPAPRPLLLAKPNYTDPLKAFPTELGQRIFRLLNSKQEVEPEPDNKLWFVADGNTIIRSMNLWQRFPVWFQQYRKENFHDDTLPPGKWTRRESKQNWRHEYMRTVRMREADNAQLTFSRPSTPSAAGSGYQTPREVREEQWRLESETTRLGKVEMRGMYKELGGRKSRTKTKVGGAATRDKGGWTDNWDTDQ